LQYKMWEGREADALRRLRIRALRSPLHATHTLGAVGASSKRPRIGSKRPSSDSRVGKRDRRATPQARKRVPIGRIGSCEHCCFFSNELRSIPMLMGPRTMRRNKTMGKRSPRGGLKRNSKHVGSGEHACARLEAGAAAPGRPSPSRRYLRTPSAKRTHPSHATSGLSTMATTTTLDMFAQMVTSKAHGN